MQVDKPKEKNKRMTVEELKNNLKIKFDFKLIYDDNWTNIYSKDDDIICSIYEGAEGILRTNYYDFKKLKLEDKKELLKNIIEYSLTPVKERERKRYFVYRLKNISDRDGFCYYLRYEDCDVFSLENFCFSIFEENDSRLDKVNLEMFEPIEVDKGGNKINE